MTFVTDDAGQAIGSALYGRTGSRTQAELLARLGAVTGTVAFGSAAGWSLVVLREGEVLEKRDVGQAPRPGEVDLPFVLHEHPVPNEEGDKGSARSKRETFLKAGIHVAEKFSDIVIILKKLGVDGE